MAESEHDPDDYTIQLVLELQAVAANFVENKHPLDSEQLLEAISIFGAWASMEGDLSLDELKLGLEKAWQASMAEKAAGHWREGNEREPQGD